MRLKDITKAVYNTLNAIEPGKVFPIVAHESTTYPFVTYQRDAIEPLKTKDGEDGVTCTFAVKVVTSADNYLDGLDLAERVTSAMFDCPVFRFVTLQGASEEYVDEAFVQNLTFGFVYEYEDNANE